MCGIHIERSKSSSLCWHLFSKKSHFVTSFLLITYIATGGFLAVMKYSRVSRPAPVGSSSNPHPSRQTTRTSRDALKTPKESTTKPSSLVYKKNWATLYSLRADISHVYLLMCLFIFWCVFSWKRSFVLYDENVPYPPWGWSLFVGINSHRAGSGMRWVRLRKCDQSIMLSIFKSCGFRSSFSLYVIFATEVSWNFAQNFVFMFAASRWTRCSFFPLSEMRNGARRGCYRGVGINLKKVPWDFFFSGASQVARELLATTASECWRSVISLSTFHAEMSVSFHERWWPHFSNTSSPYMLATYDCVNFVQGMPCWILKGIVKIIGIPEEKVTTENKTLIFILRWVLTSQNMGKISIFF